MEVLLYCLAWILVGIIVFFILVWMDLKGVDTGLRGEEGGTLTVCATIWPVVVLFIIPWMIGAHLLNRRRK